MAKSSALVSKRQHPKTFCLILGMHRLRLAWLLSKGMRRLVRKRRKGFVAVLAQPPNEVVGWGLFNPAAGAGTAGMGRIARREWFRVPW